MATNIPERSPAVWFIDNRLPPMHQMFKNAPVHFDPNLQQYTANSQPPAYVQNTGTVATPPPRPEWTDLRAMKFWDTMFSPAMDKFRSAVDVPKGRSEQYIIHKASDWEAVYTILELARNEYQNKGGKVGWWRRVRRKAADNVAPLQGVTGIAAKMAPNDPYSTPVLGAVGMLLDAAKQAATVRKQVAETFDGEGFENLIPIFSEVELFLGEMFQKDPNIHKASLELTVTTLKAVDRTVGFYTSNEFLRGGKAIVMGGDYEKQLVDSLKDISTKSAKLKEEAYKSHMYEDQRYSKQMQATVVGGFNGVYHLFKGHLEAKDAIIEQKMRQLEASYREELYRRMESEIRLKIENERLRSVSPAPPSAWQPPVLPAPTLVQAPTPLFCITQAEIRMMLGMSEVDLDDMTFIFSKEDEFPSRQRLQTEQIIQQQMFADWIVSATSSKLLVQWEAPLPRTIADLSPLSLFCAKMVQALASQDRFLSIQWFCGRHLRHNGTPGDGGRAMLLGLIEQLLRGHRGGFDLPSLSRSLDLPALMQSQDTEGLLRLLEWLVRALPQSVTLFCLVDGVGLYERREHWATAEPVLVRLLQLAHDAAVAAAVKVLFTSTPGPATVRGAFEDERLILNVETLPHLAVAPSDERFVRELGNELGA